MFDYERGLVPINATAHKRSLSLIRLDDAAAYEKNQFLKEISGVQEEGERRHKLRMIEARKPASLVTRPLVLMFFSRLCANFWSAMPYPFGAKYIVLL